MKKINLVIFGATGSIGDSLFSIIRENKNYFTVEAITCNKNITKLLKLANEFNVKSIGFNSNKLKNKNMRNLNNFKLHSIIF